MYLAVFVGTLHTMGAAVQQSGADTDEEKSSGAPAITANPGHVTVAGGAGSTEISWDTGNGSMGFVFVTTSEGKPALFATGAKGSRVAPWICGPSTERARPRRRYLKTNQRRVPSTSTKMAPAKIEIQTYASLIRRALGEWGVSGAKPPLPA